MGSKNGYRVPVTFSKVLTRTRRVFRHGYPSPMGNTCGLPMYRLLKMAIKLHDVVYALSHTNPLSKYNFLYPNCLIDGHVIKSPIYKMCKVSLLRGHQGIIKMNVCVVRSE